MYWNPSGCGISSIPVWVEPQMYNVWAVGPVGMTGDSQNCHSSRKNLNLCVCEKQTLQSHVVSALY